MLRKQMKCIENLALSYGFPTCTKFKFSSSDRYRFCVLIFVVCGIIGTSVNK